MRHALPNPLRLHLLQHVVLWVQVGKVAGVEPQAILLPDYHLRTLANLDQLNGRLCGESIQHLADS